MRLIQKTFYYTTQPTIGASFSTMVMEIDNDRSLKYEIWDTSGQDRYSSLLPMYYRAAAVIILVYDITDESTLKNIQKQCDKIHVDIKEDIIIALVGNKLDLDDQRKISTEEGTEFAKKNNIPFFFEASANTGQNIDLIFMSLAENIKAKDQKQHKY